jgi:hypothetical protein
VFSIKPFNLSKVPNSSWRKKNISIHQKIGFFQKFLEIERKLPEEKKISDC